MTERVISKENQRHLSFRGCDKLLPFTVCFDCYLLISMSIDAIVKLFSNVVIGMCTENAMTNPSEPAEHCFSAIRY